MDSEDKTDKPTGQLFSHAYLRKERDLQDSGIFRRRLGVALRKFGNAWSDASRDNPNRIHVSNYLDGELGIPLSYSSGLTLYEKYVESDLPIEKVLDLITLIAKLSRRNPGRSGGYYTSTREEATFDWWSTEIQRILEEEAMNFVLDCACGVHPYVDTKFQAVRVSILECLVDPRYAVSRESIESAYTYLGPTNIRTDSAIRESFLAVENIVKLLTGENKFNVKAVEKVTQLFDLPAMKANHNADSYKQMLRSLRAWHTSLHNYRHASGEESAKPASFEFAVFVVDSAASYLRLLVSIDRSYSQI